MSDWKITIDLKGDKIRIDYVIQMRNEDGMVSCYMPGFDMYFSAPDNASVVAISDSMIQHFFNYWIEIEGWKRFVLQIHKLGFRSKMHNSEMQNLLNNRPSKAKFSPTKISDMSGSFPALGTETIAGFSQLVA